MTLPFVHPSSYIGCVWGPQESSPDAIRELIIVIAPPVYKFLFCTHAYVPTAVSREMEAACMQHLACLMAEEVCLHSPSSESNLNRAANRWREIESPVMTIHFRCSTLRASCGDNLAAPHRLASGPHCQLLVLLDAQLAKVLGSGSHLHPAQNLHWM